MPIRNITSFTSQRPAPPPRSYRGLKVLLTVVVFVALISGVSYALHNFATDHIAKPPAPNKVIASQSAAPVADNATECSDNRLDQNIIVDISARHLWACDHATVVHDAPVVTGMAFLTADLTPTGTYHIYGKYRDTTLTGRDSTGSWNDPVSYWMPWLHNQYGSYGFHDATWRQDDDFGNISPNSKDASHGCVELPLATAKWLYNWASIGTTVTIKA